MKDKLIWCNTKEKLSKVIAKLKEDGYSVPDVDFAWISYGDEVTLRANEQYKNVTFGSRRWYRENGYGEPDMIADKFLGKNPSIVIFRRDRNVIAKDIATGNDGIAKCSPDDEFVFKTGASIALARLMAKTPDVLTDDVKTEWKKALGIKDSEKKVYTDADRNFKVGDRVVVRDWDDMGCEFEHKDGGIRKKGCFTSFIDSMKHLCGRTATVVKVYDVDRVEVNFDDKSGNTNYFYRTWMFNPTDVPAHEKEKPEAKFKVGDYVTLKEGLTADKWYGGLTLLQCAMYDNAHNHRMTVVRVDWSNDSGTYYYECKGNSQFTYHYSEEMLDKWDESKIHEGDTVKVVDSGKNYSSYPQWVGEHISDPYMAARFCFGSPSLDEKYKVIKIAEHERNHRPLAYIEQIDGIGFNKCYLIEVKGLVKV